MKTGKIWQEVFQGNRVVAEARYSEFGKIFRDREGHMSRYVIAVDPIFFFLARVHAFSSALFRPNAEEHFNLINPGWLFTLLSIYGANSWSTILVELRKAINIVFTFERLCRIFIGRDEFGGPFHCVDYVFVSGSYQYTHAS